jgi:hypothetical protein
MRSSILNYVVTVTRMKGLRLNAYAVVNIYVVTRLNYDIIYSCVWEFIPNLKMEAAISFQM